MKLKKMMNAGIGKRLARKTGVLAAAAMITGCMMVPAFAAVNTPADTDRATIEVTKVEHGATVRAYKIAEAKYTSAGLLRYQTLSGVSIADLEKPTLEEMDTIVGLINGSADGFDPEAIAMNDVTEGGTVGEGECTYRSGQLGAGMYVVLVRGTNENIYNPMIVSIGYNEESQLVAGTLDATGEFVCEAVTQAKHTRVDADKKIVNKGTAPGSANTGKGHGDTVHVGDTVQYEITADVPAYDRSAYRNVTFEVKDTLSAGQTNKQDLVIRTAAATLSASTDYTVSYNGQVMTVTFKPAWVLAHPAEKLTLSYSATVTEAIGINFHANPNDMELTYSNDPNNAAGSEKITDQTDVYSFDFKATKVDSVNPAKKLEGATFKLEGGSIPAGGLTSTTGTDGLVHFSGLDVGTYTMTETKAPNGYAVNDRVYTVVISAVFGEEQTTDASAYADGVVSKTNTGKSLTSYTVTIKDGNEVVGTSTFTADPTEANQSTADLPNTKFQNLPSTGGSGTTILTLIGVLGFIATTLLVMRRKADSEV